MNPARTAYLIRLIALQSSVAELHKFRAELAGEELSAEVYAALRDRIDFLAKKEGKA